MSPRSEEFVSSARERLRGARDALAARHPDLAVSAAYYAMLYAARAALSERDKYAKTHSGTWTLFSQTFVASEEFDPTLSALARRAKESREKGDYEAAPPTPGEAAELVDGAGEFLAAVEQLLNG
jgi:uncharacterized protein (UPF0332 family)